MAVDHHTLTHLITAVMMTVSHGAHHLIIAVIPVREGQDTRGKRNPEDTIGGAAAAALEMNTALPTHHLMTLMYQNLNLLKAEDIGMPETGGSIEETEVAETAKEDHDGLSTKGEHTGMTQILIPVKCPPWET